MNRCIRLPGRIGALQLLGIANQRIDVDVFDRSAVVFVLPVHSAASGGLPDMDPVGSPVAGSSKSGGIHRRFQQHRALPISRLPIGRQSAGTQRQDFARRTHGKIRNCPWLTIHCKLSCRRSSLHPIQASRGCISQAGDVHSRQARSRSQFPPSVDSC